MKPIRVLIVDDEPLARDCARIALSNAPDIDVVGECESGEAAIAAIQEVKPDIVLLDVQMPEMNGFEMLAALDPETMPRIIFVTAFEQHAIDAFRVHAFDYILKPYPDAQLLDAVERARRSIEKESGPDLSALLAMLRDVQIPARRLARFIVKDGDRVVFVPVAEVDWLESARNYVRLHTAKRSYLVRESLSALQQQLDPQEFARIHRSVMVRISSIREVQPWSGGDCIAILTNGEKLRVSRYYRSNLLGD